MTSYTGLVVVIPTRNRADLVQNAIRSVLTQSECEVSVLVSDNSTSTDQSAALSRHCEEFDSRRLRYVAPPQSLPIEQHWDWAIRQAMSLFDASHFTFLTDRMMFKPDALKPLIDIINTYPDKLLSYMHDKVDDFPNPVVLYQYTWTGNLYEIPSTSALELPAQSVMYDTCLPRMINCIVPRDVLGAIDRRFGDIFVSLGPDWNFCFRALDTIDSMLFYDKAALVHYGQRRSTGENLQRGNQEAFADWLNNLSAPVNFASPFPEIETVWNTIIHEYCYVKKVTQSSKFPELNMDKYRQALAVGIAQIEDPQRREHMRGLLAARGWNPPEAASPPVPQPSPPAARVRKPFWPRSVADKLVRESKNATSQLARLFSRSSSEAQPVEIESPASRAPEVERFSVNTIEFQSPEDALHYALNHPRERAAASDHATLFRGVAVPLPRSWGGEKQRE